MNFMSKVLAVFFICVAYVFAAWDKFPVKPAGQGEAKSGVEHNAQGDLSALGFNFGARFSVIEGLEVAVIGSYLLNAEYNGEDADIKKEIATSGFLQPTLGLRYRPSMGRGFFLDIKLPYATEELNPDNWVFYLGTQKSTNLTDNLLYGYELGLVMATPDKHGILPGIALNLDVELDYSFGMATPFAGFNLPVKITSDAGGNNNYGYSNNSDGDSNRNAGFMPYAGMILKINEMFSLDAKIAYALGDYFAMSTNVNPDGDGIMIIAGYLSVNF